MNGKYFKMQKEMMQREVSVSSYNCLGLHIPNSIKLKISSDMMDLKKEFLRLVSLQNRCVFSENILNLIKINYNNTNIIFDDTQIKDFDNCEHRFRLDFPKLIGIKILSVIYVFSSSEKLKYANKKIKKLSGYNINIMLNLDITKDALLEHYFRLGINEINSDTSMNNKPQQNLKFDF
jgi:hypothetical protein